MPAIFHIVQHDGTAVAHCPEQPGWILVSPNLRASRADAEGSLREHIAKTVAFAHYEVPVELNEKFGGRAA